MDPDLAEILEITGLIMRLAHRLAAIVEDRPDLPEALLLGSLPGHRGLVASLDEVRHLHAVR